MSDTELKPCPTPWCEPNHEKYTWQAPDDLFCVICDGCQLEGPYCANEGDAHDAWNTRQPDPQVTALVDALQTISHDNCLDPWAVASEALSTWEQSNA